MDLFSSSWSALRAAVAGLRDGDFARPSGCAGRLVRGLVCHLVVAAPTGDDPLDALIVRLAAAYREPWLLKFHLEDVGSAAGRAAALADRAARVGTRDQVLTAGDYLGAYVPEWTLHHLDLVAHLPDVPGPSAEGLARSREMLERIAGAALPPSFGGRDALLVGTGRRAPTGAERAALGRKAALLPFPVG